MFYLQESWSSVTYIWRHFTETHATDEDLVFPCTYCTEKFLTKGLQKTSTSSEYALVVIVVVVFVVVVVLLLQYFK
jgi:hypothetical protein